MQLVTEASDLVEVKENIHSWPGSPGLACVAFPGYAHVGGKLGKHWADEDDDLLVVDTTIEMHVGPHFHSIRYAAPIAWISGWGHDSSDEADATGWNVDSCTWDFDANDSPRIKLTIVAHCKGGPDAYLGTLALRHRTRRIGHSRHAWLDRIRALAKRVHPRTPLLELQASAATERRGASPAARQEGRARGP